MHQTKHRTELPVALIGAPASYHYQVAQAVYGSKAPLDYLPSFAAVLTAVANGTHRGILAIHNSIIGAIADNAHRLLELENKISVVQEYELPIEHCLITSHGTDWSQVRQIISHPAALQQCSDWLATQTQISTAQRADTASAVAEVCRLADPTIAAIASPFAAEYYGGTVHQVAIANQTNNVTTFAVIEPAKQQKDPMQTLQQFRHQLNQIDASIVELLGQRTQLSNAIGAFKKHHAVPIHDPKREAELVERLLQQAAQRSVPSQLIQDLYAVVLQHSRHIQTQVQSGESL